MGTVTLGVSIAVPEPHGSLLQQRRASFGDPAAHGIPTHITLLPPTEADPADRPDDRGAPGPGGRGRRRLRAAAVGHGHVPSALAGRLRPGSSRAPSACSRLQEQVRAPGGPVARELAFPYHPHVTVAHGISEESMDRAQRGARGLRGVLDGQRASPCTSRARDLRLAAPAEVRLRLRRGESPLSLSAAAPAGRRSPSPPARTSAGTFAAAALITGRRETCPRARAAGAPG